MPTRVLVTGGAGFIGSHIVDALLARGDTVRVLDSLEPPVHRSAQHGLPSDVECIQASVLNRAALRAALRGVEAVVHLAAYQDYLTDFSKFFSVNVAGTALIYELIVHDHLPVHRIVVASSQSVCGEGTYQCLVHGLVNPGPRLESQLRRQVWDVSCPVCGKFVELVPTGEHSAEPHTAYGISKYAQEQAALSLGRRYDIPTVALRYSIVHGPRQSFYNAYSGALRTFVTRLLNGHSPVIFEDGAQVRDYVWIGDVVTATLMALDDARMDYQTYNVGGDHRVTVRELFDLCREACGVDLPPLVLGLYRVGDTRHAWADVSALKRLGWAPRRDQATVVQTYVDWVREQPTIPDPFTEAAHVMTQSGVLRPSHAY